MFRYVPIQEDGQIRHRLEQVSPYVNIPGLICRSCLQTTYFITITPAHLQVLSYNLYGVINSLAACRYPGNKRHSLLIAVGEAQLSVVDYDPSGECSPSSFRLRPYFANSVDDIYFYILTLW